MNLSELASAPVESFKLVNTSEVHTSLSVRSASGDADSSTVESISERTASSSPQAIPMPSSIVSRHAMASNTFQESPLAPTASGQNNIPKWSKPKPMIGVVLTIFAMVLIFFSSLDPYYGQLPSIPTAIPIILAFHGFLVSLVWSYCAFKISGAFHYSSPLMRRYSRALRRSKEFSSALPYLHF